MKNVKVKDQSELDAALAAGNYPICVGSAFFDLPSGAKADATDSSTVRATDSSTVTAYGSSTVRATGSSTVTAYGSSTVRAYDSSTVTATGSSTVTAYGSSTVRAYDSSTVTAYGSSTVRAYGSSTVRAYGSSTVTATDSSTVTATDSSTVTATDSSTVTATDSSTVTASRYVAVHRKSKSVSVTGNCEHVIDKPSVETAEAWCEDYGIEVADGIAIVFKGVDADFNSDHGTNYSPGTAPIAADWDGGKRECGGGLHFSPTPSHTLEFAPLAKHFLACPVALSDIAIHPDAQMPQKIKAKGLCAPCYEVDIHMRRVEATKSDPLSNEVIVMEAQPC